MRKLFLLFTILFMAACQQEDIFIEDAMPLDDSGAISVITKKSGITSKSSTGDLDKDLPSFDDYYAPAVYAYPVEHFVDLRSSLNDAIQFYVDYAAYVQPTDDFDAYQDNVRLLQTELNKMEGAVVDELTLRNIFLEVLAAITPIVEAQNAILLKHAPSYLDAPTYLEIDSEDSVSERYRESDKNEATNIHFVGSIIDVNEWTDANGVIYRAFHYHEVEDGRTRTYEEGYNELTYVMFNGYDPSQVDVFWFRGIIYKRGDLQNTLHYTTDPKEYSPIANKCNQYYGATKITQGSPSLLDEINQDRQKIKFWGGSTNKEVIKESVGLKTLHSPKETKDTCGVSFDGEDGGEWGSRGTKFAIPSSQLTGKSIDIQSAPTTYFSFSNPISSTLTYLIPDPTPADNQFGGWTNPRTSGGLLHIYYLDASGFPWLVRINENTKRLVDVRTWGSGYEFDIEGNFVGKGQVKRWATHHGTHHLVDGGIAFEGKFNYYKDGSSTTSKNGVLQVSAVGFEGDAPEETPSYSNPFQMVQNAPKTYVYLTVCQNGVKEGILDDTASGFNSGWHKLIYNNLYMDPIGQITSLKNWEFVYHTYTTDYNTGDRIQITLDNGKKVLFSTTVVNGWNPCN